MTTKTGLVLEGGALRGLFSAGIMDVLMENAITFDGIVGVSAGAAFGCNYKSGQVGRAIRYNKRFAKDKRYCSMESLWRTGDLYNAEFAYRIVPTELDKFDDQAFESNPMEFYVVCTDVETGEPIYQPVMRGGQWAYDWIRASASMPVVSRVVELDGYKLLDGGVSDSIPLRFFQRKGYERNLVILTQPEGFEKKPNRLMPFIRSALKHYPRMVEAMQQRHLMYNDQLEYIRQQVRRGNTMVIYPPRPLPIGHTSHNPKAMQRVYDIGRETAMQLLDEIKAFLGQGAK
ncbi:MAG: patatin family protein [Prevotella sp.]|nr:patatin family protein [Prevotella sp.]